jgi:hypothetical protein
MFGGLFVHPTRYQMNPDADGQHHHRHLLNHRHSCCLMNSSPPLRCSPQPLARQSPHCEYALSVSFLDSKSDRLAIQSRRQQAHPSKHDRQDCGVVISCPQRTREQATAHIPYRTTVFWPSYVRTRSRKIPAKCTSNEANHCSQRLSNGQLKVRKKDSPWRLQKRLFKLYIIDAHSPLNFIYHFPLFRKPGARSVLTRTSFVSSRHSSRNSARTYRSTLSVNIFGAKAISFVHT